MTDKKHTPQAGTYRWMLAMAMAGTCAYAQTDEQTAQGSGQETELPPVTVSAHDALAVPYDQTGVSVTILDLDTLKKHGITTLPQALTTVPGVFTLPGGGDTQRGNISNIAVRGLNKAAYTLPMVDGMRIYAPGNGNPGANFMARTNLFDLGTVEVLRGAQGATYGSGTMGAVIYVETPEGSKEKPAASTFQEAGSHDSYTGNVTFQGVGEKLHYFLSTTYEHTNNDIRYADGTSATQPHAGRYTNLSEVLRLDGDINAANKLTFTFRREDAGYRDAADPYTEPGLYNFRTNITTLTWRSKLTEKWTSNLMAGYYGYDFDSRSAYGDFHSNIRNVQAEWRNSYVWSERNTTTFGAAWVRNRYDAVSGNLRSTTDCSLDNTYSIFAEHTVTPTEAWTNSLAARWDYSSVYDSHTTFRAASSYKFNGGDTRIFGSVGTGYNAPVQFQRSKAVYASAWGVYTGNTGLRCETSASADLGVEQQISESHHIGATVFLTRTKDAIVTDYATYPYSYTNDTAHQTSTGVEISMRGTFERHMNTGYTLAYTYTHPEKQDKQIACTARHTIYADLHTSPTEKLTMGIGLTAAAQRTDYNAQRQDNYYTLQVYARYDVTDNISLHLRVENLTDQKFVTQPGYFAPSMLGAGIGVFAGCTINF